MMKKNSPILIAGGHVTPALALIEELHKRDYKNIVFVGRKIAMEGDLSPSYEFREIEKQAIPFIPISTGRLNRVLTWSGVQSLLKIPYGFISAYQIVSRIKPCITVSFGGYVALPLVLASKLKGVPVITHEQTLRPGLANRVISMIANKICVAWPQTLAFFPTNKTVLTGNPLRKDLFKETKLADWEGRRPLIYICGGSLGAHTINRAVAVFLTALTSAYEVVHQSGDSKLTNDYDYLVGLKDNLPPANKRRYHIFPYVDAGRVGWLYRNASLIVCRAGANTITELAFFGTPALLIPLAWSGGGEQIQHAKLLSQCGLARTLSQEELSEKLFHTIEYMVEHAHIYKSHAPQAKTLVIQHASSIMAEIVAGYCQKNNQSTIY